MSARPRAWLADRAHPRLAALALLGLAAALLGALLVAAGVGPTGLRLAVVGFIACLVGASGYLAFAVFERGFD